MFIENLFLKKNLVELIKNKFGSYVLTKAVKFCDSKEKQKYIEQICEEVNQKNMSKHKAKWNELFRKNWPQLYPILYQKYIEKGSHYSSSSFETFSQIGTHKIRFYFKSKTEQKKEGEPHEFDEKCFGDEDFPLPSSKDKGESGFMRPPPGLSMKSYPLANQLLDKLEDSEKKEPQQERQPQSSLVAIYQNKSETTSPEINKGKSDLGSIGPPPGLSQPQSRGGGLANRIKNSRPKNF